jgi:hypothetical protein
MPIKSTLVISDFDHRDIFSLALGVPVLLLLTVLTLTGQDSGEGPRAIGILVGVFFLRFGGIPLWDFFAEKKALAKKARNASKALSPLHLPPLQPWQLHTRIPNNRDPLACLNQEQKDAWLRDLVKKTSAH